MATGGSTLHGVTDDQKRWLVFGIALSKVLVTQIRSFVEQEVQKEYGSLQTSHSIHTQSSAGRLKNWLTFLKYENINGNNTLPKLPGGRYNYSLFDCRVTSHVDFAKLYVENHMAKFNAFDEHCDASAVLALLGKVPVFSLAVQSAAGDVRQARNAWAHCVFSDWYPVNYQQSFNKMERLVKDLGLPNAFERNLLGELKDWESKGTILCMNATVDPDLLKLVQQHVNTLKTDVEQLTLEVQEDKERVSQALKDISTSLEKLEARVASVQHEQKVMQQKQSSFQSDVDTRLVSVQREQEVMKQDQSSLSNKMDTLYTDVQQRVARVEDKLSSFTLQENRGDSSCSYGDSENVVSQQGLSNLSVEIASCEGDITFFAKRHDSDTRQWFFDDFDKWFRNPSDSRAYVLLGDPGVGKSVMAGVMAQRMRKAGHLGAAYFCRHNDGTRNDPRYLLGTVARQLCDCNSQYKAIVGGEGGVKMFVANSKLGVQELFTKLLQEPLSKCLPCDQRSLVIIDALDETEYESRRDFLDLIMRRFPLLPEWLVFFITSRPEDSVQFRLKKYNPCVKICAGNSDQDNFYQQHEQDIQIFLKKRIDFFRLSFTVEDIAKKCNGLFLYAHYIVEELRLFVNSGEELNQLSDLFPGDIDSFFLQNFERVYDQVGQDIFKKLFGCAIVAPSPLPVSIISHILKREKSNYDEQQVIDAVSQFEVLRTSDQTLTFLHNLIPAWLTDKNRASRELFIDKKIAGEYLRKVFVEILPFVANEPRTGPSIDVDLKDYVSRVAVRFLCENGAEDSLKVVFDCLTNYYFIERRMKYGRIEIYHLLEDFRLVAGHFAPEEVSKQEILQEILFAIESSVLVLLECPHLVHLCIRDASNAVQETVTIPQVSAPWLECSSVYASPFVVNADISNMRCFATAPDKRTVAGSNGRSLQFFDASTVKRVSGPFYLGNNAIHDIAHLEFSPDGKFLFFGRLDKWFSVERGCVEDFPQFSGNFHVYKWGVFTRDGQCLVVKKRFLPNSCACEAQSFVFNFLALWALKEIEQSGEDEMTVSFSPDGWNQEEPCEAEVEIENLFKRVGMVRMEPLFERLGMVHMKRLFERLGTKGIWVEGSVRHNPSCWYCRRLRELTQLNQEPSLATVRQLVIELYPFIFNYQVWDLQTGMPVLHQVFSKGIQLNPFTYFCHVACAYSEDGLQMKCSGIEKAMSLCNIAIVTAVCRFLPELKLQRVIQLVWPRHRHNLKMIPLEIVQRLMRHPFGWKSPEDLLLEVLERGQLSDAEFRLLETTEHSKLGIEQSTKWQYFLSPELFREVHNNDPFKIGFLRNIPKGFQDLVNGVNGEILPCVSPEMKWVIQADDSLKVSLLQTGNQEQHHIHHEKPEHTFSKFTRFTFTNDDLYFVYSSEGSLRALSLKTGTVLTSVSGRNLCYFTRERQVGYLFRCVTEETTIFLTSLFSPFKFLPASPVVGKSVAAMFRSSDTLMSVSSELVVTLWQTSTFAEEVVIPSSSEFTLTAWRGCGQSLHGRNCVLSSDGRLIAVYLEAKLELYSSAESKLKFLYSKCQSTVTCFAFSADNTALLFCTQDSRNDSYFYVWDIQEEVVSARFESRGNLTAECCCLFSNKQALVLCGDYEIEIWEYAEHTCRLLRRLGVEKPYNSVEFSQCTVSVDNQFLVCCIADVILVYSLHASNINSSKQVLRGHLGRIEFCRFLKINRYLVSYGVDGMVFLWDISESKAVGFARIVEGQESIVSMAVSPEEDTAVCFMSSGRVCVVKLCELGSALSLKPLTALVNGELKTGETSLQPLDIADSFSSCDSEESYYLEDLEESD